MDDPLEGIREKLKRADECIFNLDGEINSFFDEGKYRVIPDQDSQFFDVAIDYHFRRPIPLRFSVLAGEIAHHLRSCLDHLAWQLSSEEERTGRPDRIEFPVFDECPASKDELSRYNRKIKGLSKGAKEFIGSFQPYLGPDPTIDPLFIIHEMNRLDKHRELIIVYTGFQRKMGSSAREFFWQYNQMKTEEAWANLQAAFKADSQVTPQIAFGKIGGWENKAVVPCLAELLSYVRIVIEESRRLFK